MTFGGHLRIAALACCNADNQLVPIALVAEGSGGKLCGIVTIVAVVFIHLETSVLSAREYTYDNFLPCATKIPKLAIEWQDAASLDIDGILIDGKGALQRLAAFQHRACLILQPVAFWQPNFHPHVTVFTDGFHDRRNHHVIAEHILTAEVVGLLLQRIVIIHGTAERNACLIILASHRINIRYERVTSVDDALQSAFCGMVEGPRLLVQRRVFGGVGAQDGQVLSHLHGTGIELRGNRCSPFQAHVSANVVAPIAVKHVRGSTVEIRQESQTLPRNVAVA